MLDAVVEALPPTGDNRKATIVLASNDKYMYEELPEELKSLTATAKRTALFSCLVL